jgi:hypothetical protein
MCHPSIIEWGKVGNVTLHNILIKDVSYVRESEKPPKGKKRCDETLWNTPEIQKKLQDDIDKIRNSSL